MRFCPNCGTEVDETAVFCPTCGQAIGQAAETEMPAAPAWPEPSAAAEGPRAAQQSDATADSARTENRPQTPPPPGAEATGPSVNVPVTLPVTLSGWLIGVGALIGALGVVVGLLDGGFNVVELVLLLALPAVSAAVFFSSSLTNLPNLRLATLVVVLIGFGVALALIGFGGAGAGELLLFLGTAAAAMGAIILELGRDQPLGPSR